MGCRACGQCCRSVRVPLTDVDLWRLARATGLAPQELVDWLAPEDVDMTGEPESFVLIEPGRRLMTLAFGAQGCRLLDPEGRCSAYRARPTSCRSYPWDESGALPFAACDFAREAPPDCAELARQQRDELARYADLVARFNRRQRSRRMLRRRSQPATAFFAFLERAWREPGKSATMG